MRHGRFERDGTPAFVWTVILDQRTEEKRLVEGTRRSSDPLRNLELLWLGRSPEQYKVLPFKRSCHIAPALCYKAVCTCKT